MKAKEFAQSMNEEFRDFKYQDLVAAVAPIDEEEARLKELQRHIAPIITKANVFLKDINEYLMSKRRNIKQAEAALALYQECDQRWRAMWNRLSPDLQKVLGTFEYRIQVARADRKVATIVWPNVQDWMPNSILKEHEREDQERKLNGFFLDVARRVFG